MDDGADPLGDDVGLERGLLGIVDGGVRVFGVPVEAGGGDGPRQYGLAIGHPGQRDRVEHTEGMERVALVADPRHRRIEEVQVEVRVVAHQDRALAAVLLHRRAHRREHMVQRLLLVLGEAERMIQVDPRDLQRLGVDLGTGRRVQVHAGSGPHHQQAVLVQIQRHGGQFEQGVAVPVEAAGLHVHHDGQVAAEAAGHGGGADGFGGVFHARKGSRGRHFLCWKPNHTSGLL